MAPKKQLEHMKTSDDEYDAEFSPDDEEPQRGTRRSTRRQRSGRANLTQSRGDDASPAPKPSTIVLNVATKKRGQKSETGSKGEVRYTDEGAFEYYDPKSKQWIPAAYHNDHRQEFIEGDAPQDGFDWEPKRGCAEFDETSYKDVQRLWSGDHLERIVDPAGKKVMFDLDRPKLPKPADPGNWMLGDKVLLDHNDHPVKAWTDLNKTLSTEIEDWRLEAIRRLYWWLTTTDILARMPHFRQKTEGGVFVPLQSSRAFTNRAMRFRQPKAIIPTNQRKGTTAMVEFMRTRLEKHNAETAEGLPELTPAELKKAKKANKGKFSMNSRYIDEEDVASKSGKIKREAEEDSDNQTAKSRAKRVKREHDSSSPIFAPMPIPHDRNARIPPASQTNHLTLEDPEMAVHIPYTTDDEDAITLVPLFVSLDCEELAAIQDSTYTTPRIVLEAKANGCTMLNEVEVRWYRDDIEREIDENGVEHPYVVMREAWQNVKLDEQGNRVKDDDDCGAMAPKDGDNDDHVSHSPIASDVAEDRNLAQTPALAPAAPPTSLPIYYTPAVDEEEAQLYENPWLHHYGPSGY